MIFFLFLGSPSQTLYLGKFLFWSNDVKCSQPIRLQDFKLQYLKKYLSYEVIFLHITRHLWRQQIY